MKKLKNKQFILLIPIIKHKMAHILKIRLHNHDLYSLYKNHGPQYEGDSGIDLFVSEAIYVPPNACGFPINLGVSLEFINKKSNKSCSFFMMARSSLSNTPLRLSNSIYLIDAGFRGNLCCFVDNLSNQPIKINFGDRLVQVLVSLESHIEVQMVHSLSPGSRDNKGLGSTNKNNAKL